MASSEAPPPAEAASAASEQVPKTKVPPPRSRAGGAVSVQGSVRDEPTDECFLKFGKHIGKRFDYVLENEPAYAYWCVTHLRDSTENHRVWLEYIEKKTSEQPHKYHFKTRPAKDRQRDDDWEEVDDFRDRVDTLEKETQSLRDEAREMKLEMREMMYHVNEMTTRFLQLEANFAKVMAHIHQPRKDEEAHV